MRMAAPALAVGAIVKFDPIPIQALVKGCGIAYICDAGARHEGQEQQETAQVETRSRGVRAGKP